MPSRREVRRAKRQRSVHQVTVDRIGLRRAVLVHALISVWSVFRYEHDRDPENVAELVENVDRDHATVYRWLSHFRECFPEFADPGALLDACGVPMHRPVSASRAGGLVLPEVEGG